MDYLANGLPAVKLTPSPDQVTAASISRIFRHFSTQSIDIGIAILTSDRGDRALSLDQKGRAVLDVPLNERLNKAMRQRLTKTLGSLGHRGWIRVWGAYPEEAPSEPVFEKRGDKLTPKVGKDVKEQSYLVPAVSLDEAKRLAKVLGKGARLNGQRVEQKVQDPQKLADDFRQDSILWANNRAGAFLIYHDGRIEKIGDKFEPNTLQRYFTQWRSRRFSFAALLGLEYDPDGPSDYRQWRRELVEQCLTV